jgi:hypothetical protein
MRRLATSVDRQDERARSARSAACAAWPRLRVARALPARQDERMQRNELAYRTAVLLAVATAMFLAWGIGALGVLGADGTAHDVLFVAVFAVLIVGTLVARLEPIGMARTLCATAVTQAGVGVVAVTTGRHDASAPVGEVLGLTAMFGALWLASAWLFRRCRARERGDRAIAHTSSR